MSRTNKDRKWELRFPHEAYFRKFGETEQPGIKKKLKRKVEKYKWWQGSPSWWTRMCMTRPKRRACRIFERSVLFSDIEEADCPDYGRRPHIYFY